MLAGSFTTMTPTTPSPVLLPDLLADLVRRAAAGERSALRGIYDRLAARVLAVGRAVLGDGAEAEDVVQETFVEVWRRASEFDATRGTPEAWVLVIARSRALNRRRARGSAGRTAEAAALEPGADAPLPDDLAGVAAGRSRLATALQALPAEQRKVIELAYFEGLSQREIAAHTGQPLGTIKTRAKLGLEKLAALVAGKAEVAS